MVALPPVGGARPSSMRRAVVFPAPFGPRKPTTRPDSTSKLTWSTATSPPKRLVRSRNSITATAANLPVRSGYRRGADTPPAAPESASEPGDREQADPHALRVDDPVQVGWGSASPLPAGDSRSP